MKLLYHITWRISVALLFLSAAWGIVFYIAVINEINDETDDSLEDYSESIIVRALSGEKLPEQDNGTNNSYYINEVPEEYAVLYPSMRFIDDEIYIYSKKETEPARILKTIFRDSEKRYYELTVLIPTIEKSDLKQTILTWIVILDLILLLSVLAVNAIVLRRSLRPLHAMLDWLNDLRLGKEIPPLELNSDISEYKKLSDELVESAQRNNTIYEQQSLFIGHASHELQTPIAVAQNRLELLAEDPDLNEEQMEQIVKTIRSLEDISRLNKTLLLLTKIENKQFPEIETVDINQMVCSIAGDLKEVYASKEMAFRLSETARLKMEMNRMLASVLFGNLLKNAFIHSEKHGMIDVSISDAGVRIANTAVSGALNPEYIFRRFYQENKSRGAAGLGLSLVDSIAKLYGITVSYLFTEGMHIFEVRLPKS
jgi:two-component system sensor histidine kinase QseC